MKKPKKPVVRLNVVYREVTCPFGRGKRRLHDCYMDSVTPNHFCVDPLKDGSTRCPRIEAFRSQYGLRTYHVKPQNHGVPTAGDKTWVGPRVRLVFNPLDLDATRWMALNVCNGERKEVVLAQVDARGAVRQPAMANDGALLEYPFTGWRDGGAITPHPDCPSCAQMLSACAWHRNGSPYPGFVERKEISMGDMMIVGRSDRLPSADPNCKDCQTTYRVFGGCPTHREAARKAQLADKPDNSSWPTRTERKVAPVTVTKKAAPAPKKQPKVDRDKVETVGDILSSELSKLKRKK